MQTSDMIKVILTDFGNLMVSKWHQQLKGLCNSNIEVFGGKLQDLKLSLGPENSAIVSPANGIGCMAGGFDLALCEMYEGPKEQNKENYNGQVGALELFVKKSIDKASDGYLPITTSILIDCTPLNGFKESHAWNQLRARYIIACPTMRVPKKLYLSSLIHDDEAKREIIRFIFDYVWNAIQRVKNHNIYSKSKVSVIIIPGLGTGYGGLPPDLVSKAMLGAINLSLNHEIKGIHKGLLALKFLGENYNSFDNDDLKDYATILNSWKYDVLNEDIAEFFSKISFKNL